MKIQTVEEFQFDKFFYLFYFIININLQFYTSEFNRWLELKFEILDN